MKTTHVLSFVSAFTLLISSVAQSAKPAAGPAGSGITAPSTGVQPPADTAGAAKKKAPATASQPGGFPFRGTLKAVDKAAMTLTIAGKEKDRVVYLTSETRYTKDGKPATLADAAVSGEVGGYAKKGKEGRTEAVSVRFGPAVKAAKAPSTKQTKAAKAETAPMP